MKLTPEECQTLVKYRVEKSARTFIEAKGNCQMGFWNAAANRLYYSAYYMAAALLISNGIDAHTHTGTIRLLGVNFIKTGKLEPELGDLYSYLFELRQSGDYSDTFEMTQNRVEPLLEPTQKLLNALEALIEK